MISTTALRSHMHTA